MIREKGWVLITGAGRGLGAAVGREMAKAGYHLVLHYNKSERECREVAHQCQKFGGKVEILQGDFSSEEGVNDFLRRYLARFPDTFGLIYNVGNYLIKPVEKTSVGEWKGLFQTNVFAPIALMNGLSDSLKRARGRVIAIGTVGLNRPKAFRKAVAYSVGKSALYQTLLSYAREWISEGVTVNMVSPGVLENSSDLTEESLPLGKPVALQEIAQMVEVLFKPESSSITGQNIEIAAGFSL